MMKPNVNFKLLILALFVIGAIQAKAQYMPVVYDNRYGTDIEIAKVCPVSDGEIVLIGHDNGAYKLSLVDRVGTVSLTLSLNRYTAVEAVTYLGNNRVLVVGQAVAEQSGRRGSGNVATQGAASIVDLSNRDVANFFVGGNGTRILAGQELTDGSLILSGTELTRTNARSGVIYKLSSEGRMVYRYAAVGTGYCDRFYVLGEHAESVCAAFSGDRTGERSLAVRLDGTGHPIYTTVLPATGFVAQAVDGEVITGSFYIAGVSQLTGAYIYKIRPEGDIVFEKNIIPDVDLQSSITHMSLTPQNNILVSGNGTSSFAYYALLRNDGTTLYQGRQQGTVQGVDVNPITGQSVFVIADETVNRTTFVKVHSSGNAEFERTIPGVFERASISNAGEVLLMSLSQGRVSLFSSQGDLQFDRYVFPDRPFGFKEVYPALSGELVFLADGGRLVKLGHGLYVSDATVTKPVNGQTSVIFTITLTGYASTDQGQPVPVTVSYKTQELSATEENNFVPVSGQLYFTPSQTEKYLINRQVEVPVKSNDLVEGLKEFNLVLTDVDNSYIVKSAGNALIEDQPAFVRLISTEKGIEGDKDLSLSLGLFKSDGTPLANATGANIIVDGFYGEGSEADHRDFDMANKPRVVIASGQHSGDFAVSTFVDNRYENEKRVEIHFNQIHAISDSKVSYGSDMLTCEAAIIDRPAYARIVPLGDHRHNNVVSGFFAISLHAEDGTPLLNSTGEDIVVVCKPSDGTAVEGVDYVYTNLHNLVISGLGNTGSAHVNGVVLYNPKAEADSTVKLKIESLNRPKGAPRISVEAGADTAEFVIKR